MEKLAIVLRDDAYNRLYTPLTFAYIAAKKGIEVNVLFVLWAVRVLTEKGAKAVAIDPQHATEEEWFKERLQRDGDPPEILDFIKFVKQTGNVHFYGCKLAAATFDVAAAQLIPEADGIVDALWFLGRSLLSVDEFSSLILKL